MAGIAEFNWVTALIGGMLIGVSSTILLAFNGRIAGFTGIVNGAISFKGDVSWRWAFLISSIAGGAFYQYFLAPRSALPETPQPSLVPWALIIGGFIVGFGTRMGNGCTSGHGVCGLGRLSPRSLVAVVTFLGAGFVTVFILHQVLGLNYF